MRYWTEHAGTLKRELAAALDHDRLVELHRRRPWRHFLITARHVALCARGRRAALKKKNIEP